MGHSKNDFPCMGGTIRCITRPARDKYDAICKILNPKTNCPYTNKELVEELKQRQIEQPALAQMIESEIRIIEQKAHKHPTAEYQLSCRGDTKEEAKQQAKKKLLPKIENIAKLLFRPQWESNISSGNITVNQYVHYMGDTLYAGVNEDTRKHLSSVLNSVILPEIGTMYLCELDNATQEKLIRKINRTLNKQKAHKSKRGYAKQAYKLLFQSIESIGYNRCSGGIRLAEMITQTNSKNSALLNSIRQACLTDKQRETLFTLLSEKNLLYLLFMVALIYSGLEACEISALHFGEFQKLLLLNGSCYTITVSKIVRKVDKRYSTISATNNDFPICRLRKVVLYPWATDILLRYTEDLLRQGYSKDQIFQMRLSDETPNGAIVGPKEIAEKIEPLLVEAGVEEVQIPRTRKDGSVYQKTEPVSIDILYRDAQHIAKEYCGVDSIMMHAMFGLSRTETDEEAYLDILAKEYTVRRYSYLKRFSPFERRYPQRHIIKVENNTDQPQILELKSDYGMKSYWKENTDERKN